MPATGVRIAWRLLLFLTLHAAPFSSYAQFADPFPGLLPATDVGGSLPAGFEPSGSVWHPRLNVLFVVSDSGIVATLDGDGQLLTIWNVPGDLERVTVAAPLGPFVYLAVEHPDAVLEFDIVNGWVTREFDLTGTLTGPNGSGLEALTFVPNASQPEGGRFYAGLQEDGQVYVFELPIESSNVSTAVQHIETFAPVVGRDDLSALDWLADQALLYAGYDRHDRLLAMDVAGNVIAEWELPGTAQEGLAFAGCRLFVPGDSTAEVLRYIFPTDPTDTDLDGWSDCIDCAPLDASAATLPNPVTELRLDPPAGATRLQWTADTPLVDLGWGWGADLVSEGNFGSALCLAGNLTAVDFTDSSADPAPGALRYYLVRGVNACGPGTYGESAAGTQRLLPAACP